MKIVLGITGSVAATLTPKIVKALLEEGHEVKVVTTERGAYFFNAFDVSVQGVEVLRDKDEWPEDGYKKGAIVPHIDLHKWADMLLIAPLTADTLTDIAIGKADKFLTCIAYAWPLDKPFAVAPAMNTNMWNDPLTKDHLTQIDERYLKFKVIDPISNMLACGDVGMGAMAKIQTIVDTVKRFEAIEEKK